MKRWLISACCLCLALHLSAQDLTLSKAKFRQGDNVAWSNPGADDSQWRVLDTSKGWTEQGVNRENSYGWYRVSFELTPELARKARSVGSLLLQIGQVDDADETYLNGQLVGKTGRMPGDKGGFMSAWNTQRAYEVSAKSKALRLQGTNVLCVRVYNNSGDGGIKANAIRIRVPDPIEGVSLSFKDGTGKRGPLCAVTVANAFSMKQRGRLEIKMLDSESGVIGTSVNSGLSLSGHQSKIKTVPYDIHKMWVMQVRYTDASSGKTLEREYTPRCILTPEAPETPQLNNARYYGVRPGSPVIYRIPATGMRPMRFSVKGLPEGLRLDADKGVITGSIEFQGDYDMTLVAENARGRAESRWTVRVGDKMALTPPMGWNSWNCWGKSVSQEKVRSSAQALIDKGLADYGYCYINIDNGWQATQRNADGTIATNEKFPDIKALVDWLHGNGLKFGIYSSPGHLTCGVGDYPGSLNHEEQDAKTYNEWGVDYLKYDWCTYAEEAVRLKDTGLPSYVRPYLKMQFYLRQQPRDIFYSLCQYGMGEVWKWGPWVDANSWRTTGDITDTWASLYEIGFRRQAGLYPYAAPGHWNDPDMLIVGKVGWSANLRNTRLTPVEQYTHITLWTLLASNMLIGCDIAQMDDFTRSLLCNREVNAVNQDALGQQARPEVVDGDIQIWKRPLYDGNYAVGIFNLGDRGCKVDFRSYFGKLGIGQLTAVRDLWRQQDLPVDRTEYFIPSHGVKYLKIKY